MLEGDLNAAAVAHHHAWRLGRSTTAQRLVVSKKAYREKDCQVWQLNAVRIEDCTFQEADFRYATLHEADLVRCEFRRSLFLSAQMQHAHLVDVYAENCNFNLVRLNSVTTQGFTLADCQAFRSQWLDAKVSTLDLIKCSFHDSTWNGAVVSNSDFRGTHLGATIGFGELATTVGATFVDCDLRNTTWRGRDLSGATFIRCRFRRSGDEKYSAVGAPRAVDGLIVIDCDVSRAELLDELLRVDDVPMPA